MKISSCRSVVVTALVAVVTVGLVTGGVVTPFPAADAATMTSVPPAPKPTRAPANAVAAPTEIVVRVIVGANITDITDAYPIAVDGAVLASRGIWLVHPTDDRTRLDPARAAGLATTISHDRRVVYAQMDEPVRLADTQFHSWPYGSPTSASSSAWAGQLAVAQLQLSAAHHFSTGAGVTVAVLDTGVDASVPVLAGHVDPGWDYVADDADPADRADGSDDNQDGLSDEAVGHGTFVSGLMSLVAPQARILPLRVLDADGSGNVFIIAQAILDAVSAGARVINLSFGTSGATHSRLLDDAVAEAQRRGSVVVAAAGNDGSNTPHYPASLPSVVSVGALDTAGHLTGWSDRGGWVKVAAPGAELLGPLPGGRWGTWSGTSMATPLAAGQIALLSSAAPTAAAHTLIDTVHRTAMKMSSAGVAYGAIDVLRSLQMILEPR